MASGAVVAWSCAGNRDAGRTIEHLIGDNLAPRLTTASRPLPAEQLTRLVSRFQLDDGATPTATGVRKPAARATLRLP